MDACDLCIHGRPEDGVGQGEDAMAGAVLGQQHGVAAGQVAKVILFGKVVTRISGGHHQAGLGITGNCTNVGILTSRGDAGGSDRDDCARRQRYVAGERVLRRQLIIGQGHVG